jgi:GTP-binding protein
VERAADLSQYGKGWVEDEVDLSPAETKAAQKAAEKAARKEARELAAAQDRQDTTSGDV